MDNMKKIVIVSLFLFSSGSHAFEITSLFGLRGGGEFIDETNGKKHTIVSSNIYGLIIDFPYEDGKTLEIYYSHQSSDLKSMNLVGSD